MRQERICPVTGKICDQPLACVLGDGSCTKQSDVLFLFSEPPTNVAKQEPLNKRKLDRWQSEQKSKKY